MPQNQGLGTSGREDIPYEYQQPLIKAARQRKIAEAMLARMQQRDPTQVVSGIAVKQHPLEHLAKALSGYLGYKGIGAADEAEATAMQKMQAGRQSDMQAVQELLRPRQQQVRSPGAILDKDFTAGDETIPTETQMAPPDIQAAIAKAMSSSFGSVRSQGEALRKDYDARREALIKVLTDRDPATAAAIAQSGRMDGITPNIPTPRVAFQKDPSGNDYALTTNTKGEPHVSWAPKANQTSLNVNTAPKLGAKVNEQQASHFAYGGKGREDADAIEKSMQTTQETLQALTRNPAMGAGAEGFQVLRKWAEVLGADMKDITTNTEQMKMLLGERALAALGGKLGAQVSDADRKFIMENLGQINSDPEAVRRILLTTAKYQMAAQNKYNQGVDLMQGRLEGEATLPRLTGGIRFADDEDAAAFEEVYRGGVPKRRYGKIVPKPAPSSPPPEIRFVEPVPR